MDWTYNIIWMDQLKRGEYCQIEFKEKNFDPAKKYSGSYFIFEDFCSEDKCFSNFRTVSSAIYLELNRGNIYSLKGISNLGSIKRLELHYCTKFKTFDGIQEIEQHLEWIHVNQSRKITVDKHLLSLKNLKVLCLNNCGSIESLQFIKNFPKLIDFRFVNTDVVDGDLTPLMEHPSLKNVRFSNKRNFNLKVNDVERHFDGSVSSVQEWAQRGSFRTFRYNVF